MKATIIKDARIVNEGRIIEADLLIKDGRIEKISSTISIKEAFEIDAKGDFLIPGIIDDQVHFREPGLTHKADIHSEARAAVAGGVTSFMEMPNTNPTTTTLEELVLKNKIAEHKSLANYSFYFGATNDNLSEVLKVKPQDTCGIKVFMGSSTGDMLVDNDESLEKLFAECNMLIATHCEDENTIRHNLAHYREHYNEDIPIHVHPLIRNERACYLSSSKAIELAKRYNTRLHVLHISTANELDLFSNQIPLPEKRITSEVCVHHLYFNADDYTKYGTQIKCNPAIKSKENQEALLPALLDDRLDIIATDHAPHTWKEKQFVYAYSPSGVPLIQHSLNIMLSFYHENKISIEKIVEKMCHAPAQCFRVSERGYIREGYFADLALVDINQKWKVSKDNILYKCGWSPFENHQMKGRVRMTFVNGNIVYNEGLLNENHKGQRLLFY